jgi:hypothetical protein
MSLLKVRPAGRRWPGLDHALEPDVSSFKGARGFADWTSRGEY